MNEISAHRKAQRRDFCCFRDIFVIKIHGPSWKPSLGEEVVLFCLLKAFEILQNFRKTRLLGAFCKLNNYWSTNAKSFSVTSPKTIFGWIRAKTLLFGLHDVKPPTPIYSRPVPLFFMSSMILKSILSFSTAASFINFLLLVEHSNEIRNQSNLSFFVEVCK